MIEAWGVWSQPGNRVSCLCLRLRAMRACERRRRCACSPYGQGLGPWRRDHGRPREIMGDHGRSWETTMEAHERPWETTGDHGRPWKTTGIPGGRAISNFLKKSLRKPPETTGDHGRPGIPRETMADHGRPWQTMGDHGRPQETMADHGRP